MSYVSLYNKNVSQKTFITLCNVILTAAAKVRHEFLHAHKLTKGVTLYI